MPDRPAGVVYDADGDGLASFRGFTDRYGRLVTNCDRPGLDCVPLHLLDVPVARSQHRDTEHLGLSEAGTVDFDVSPPGEHWIRFPN